MRKQSERPASEFELGEANESVSRFVAYWSTYLFWTSVFLLSVIIAFM